MTEVAEPEARPASEAVLALTRMTLAQIHTMSENLGGIALRDAKLDPADGWRYDLGLGTYVKVP